MRLSACVLLPFVYFCVLVVKDVVASQITVPPRSFCRHSFYPQAKRPIGLEGAH